MHINFQMIVLICMAAISCMLGVSILRGKLRGPGAKTVSLMMFAGSFWLLGFAFEIGSPSFNAKMIWDVISFLPTIVLPIAWLFFVFQFSGREEIVNTRNIILFSIVPTIFFLLVVTNPSHGLMWNNLRFDEDGIFLELKKSFGPLYWVFLLYAFSHLFVGVYLTIQMLVHSMYVYKFQASTVLVASIIPVVGVLLTVFDVGSFARMDIGPIATGISTWLMGWIVLRSRLIDTMRMARDTVLERMSHGVMVLYAKNEIVYLNAVAEELIGLKLEEVKGTQLEAHWSQWPGGCESMGDHLEVTKEITQGEGEAKHTHELRMSPLLDWRGRFVGQVVLTKDITHRIQTEKVLREYADQLKRSNQELEQFAYIASHDLQEPLRAVACHTQLLARRYMDVLDEDAKEYIHFAVDGATRMQQLIEDLLEYSRVGTKGKFFTETNTTELLQRVLNSLQMTIEESNAKISYNGMPTLQADTTQLGQLFQNLIGNAIKFQGDETPEIEILTEKQADEWHFTVRDNGIGIEERYFDRIFQIFQRLHRPQDYPGTGMGLAICKRIVERHGGKIWVESSPGIGSEFHFTLPERRKESA
jgi:signal transduction histidine kinase